MKVIPILDEKNGCSSYIVGDEISGDAVVIDPLRNVGYENYILTATSNGLRIAGIVETHVHADHFTESKDLAAELGILPSISANAPAQFEFNPLKDGDIMDLGFLKIKIIDTPGHTPDSISLVASDTSRSGEPWCVFTGDSLFVGDIGRPDLVDSSKDAVSKAANQQHNSVYTKLMSLPDYVEIYPAHSGSSSCGGLFLNPKFNSTIGFEKNFNIFLNQKNRDDFSKKLLQSMKPAPTKAKEIREWNLSAKTTHRKIEVAGNE